MSDVPPGAPANPDNKTLPTQPTGAPNGSDNNNSTGITRADFDALMQRVNSQSGIISRLERELTRAKTPNAEPANEPNQPNPPPRLSAADKDLMARLEKVEAKEARLRERAKDEAVRAAAKTAGVSEDRLTEFERYFKFEPEYKRLKWNDDTDSVEFTDEYERPSTLADHLKKFLSTPTGQFYINTPNVTPAPRRGGTPNSNQKTFMDYTPSELAKLPPEQQKALLSAARAS